MGYSQQEINESIKYHHRLCDRMLELIQDIQVLDKSTLLAFSQEDITELGQLMVPVYEKMQEMRKNKPTLAQHLDKRTGKR
jgi:hypothetical protein